MSGCVFVWDSDTRKPRGENAADKAVKGLWRGLTKGVMNWREDL